MPRIELLPIVRNPELILSYLNTNFNRVADAVKDLSENGHAHDYGEDADWQYPTFENGWTDYGSGWARVRYRKLRSGLVVLSGLARTSTTNNGTSIFTLPAGHRVASGLHFPVVWSDTLGTLQVNTNGTVVGRGFGTTSTWFSLDGCTFFAEA